MQRVKTAQTPALMVNYIGDRSFLDDNCFGGAFLISAKGEVVASHPLGVEGTLIVDIDKPSKKPMQATRYPRV